MMKFKKQELIVGTMLFLIGIVASQSLSAANILKIGTYSVEPSTEFTIQLEAENSSPFVAFQADIPLPTGFKYVDGSALLNASRISGHALSASLLTGNILRLIGFSVSNTAFTGTSGALVSFKMKSGTNPATYALAIQNPLLGDSQSNNILTSSVNGAVTILAPNIKLSTTDLNYGRVPLGTDVTQYIQVTNEGNRDLIINSLTFNDTQFTTTDATPITIGPNNTRSVAVKFTPTVKGTFAKQVQMNSNDLDQPTATIVLNAIAFAVNELHTGNFAGASSSTGRLDFSLNNMEAFTGFQFDITLPQPMTYALESAQLFRSADHSVSVNQLNAQTLRVLAFSASNNNFTGTEGKVLSLDFALKGVASWYSIGISNVIIANTSGENIVSESFGGYLQITSPDIDAPTQLNFGDVSILSSSTKLHRIYNYGQEALTITQLMFNSDYFKSSQTLPVTIQPSTYLDLPVEFTKSIKGAATGTVKIISNDPDENPFTIQLSGNAFAPNYLLISPQSFIQGESKNVAIEVENEEPFVAVQFDLSYPAGFTPDLNAVALTARKQDHGIAVVALTANSLRVLVYSMGQKTFTGKTGAILNIPFKAELSMAPGAYSLIFSNTLMSNIKSENILYASNNGSLTIQKLNHAPLANAGAVQLINEGTTVTLDGSASSDADGNPITYQWTAPAGITLSSLTVAKPTFTAPEVNVNTDYAFSLVTNDGTLNSSSDEVIVTVKNVSTKQQIVLNVGWNIISSMVVPTNLDLKTIFQPLIDAGKLKKIMDENGKTIENFGGFGGWVNNIGNLVSTEGFKVNVTAASTLSLEGTPVSLPFDIQLNTGWNIISYPSSTTQDAKAVFQSLIDAGKLKKVMDESGKTIENFGDFGGWVNNIGNLLPGKGYKVSVTTNCILTIPVNGTKSAVIVPEMLASEHFKLVYIGNGTDHMSINLVNLQASGLFEGDEIGIFDGKNCVGSATVGTEQLIADFMSIQASSNDHLSETIDGFINGNPIVLQLYRGGQTSVVKLTKISGNELFESNGSLFATINANEQTTVQTTGVSASFKCFPNPFTQEITIEVQNSGKSEVNVEIYNFMGQLIKKLYQGNQMEHLILKWNGANDSGQKVAPGVYLCKVNGMVRQVLFEGRNGKK